MIFPSNCCEISTLVAHKRFRSLRTGAKWQSKGWKISKKAWIGQVRSGPHKFWLSVLICWRDWGWNHNNRIVGEEIPFRLVFSLKEFDGSLQGHHSLAGAIRWILSKSCQVKSSQPDVLASCFFCALLFIRRNNTSVRSPQPKLNFIKTENF